MRLLFLSTIYPLPADNGVKMRTWQVLRALAVEGHDVTLLSFAEGSEVNGQHQLLQEVCRSVECIGRETKSLSANANYGDRLRGLFSQLPYGVRQFRSEAVERRIRSLVEDREIDGIVSEQADALVNVPARLPVPLIVDHQNVEHRILYRYLRFEPNPLKKAYAWLEARKVRSWERRACRRAAVGLACSDCDSQQFEALTPGLRMVVAPNVVDTDLDQPVPREEAGSVLYHGGMDWYPNRDAVEFFMAQIFPQLRRLCPGVKFVVAGRNPPEDFRTRLERVPGLEVTGTVPDMRLLVAKAAVCVVPLRIGSGTRLKILEAGAMGKPVVSTRLGAEGLEFVDGEEIILADDPASFASAVAGLLADEPRRRALGQAARRRVEQRYSFAVLRGALRQALAGLPAGVPY